MEKKAPISVSPYGESFELPSKEQYDAEFKRIKKLADQVRGEGKEVVVVMGMGFVGVVMAAIVALALIPLNLWLPRKRPEDVGLQPDGDDWAPDGTNPSVHDAVVDRSWVAVDWTLPRAIRTTRSGGSSLAILAHCSPGIRYRFTRPDISSTSDSIAPLLRRLLAWLVCSVSSDKSA